MTRIRNESSTESWPYLVTENWQGGGTSSNRIHTVSKHRVMVDEVNPDFKKRSARGELMFSPMERYVTTPLFKPSGISISAYKWKTLPAPHWSWTNTWATSCDEELPGLKSLTWDPRVDQSILDEIDRLEALAVTEAYAEVGSPDLELLVELAELKETLGFLWSPVKKMVNLTRRFQRHLRREARLMSRYRTALAKYHALPPHVRKKRSPPVRPKIPPFRVGDFAATDLSSAWLAYRYGLMPLIYTFQDVQKLIKKMSESSKPVRATARAVAKSEIDPVYDSGWTPGVYAGASFEKKSYFQGIGTIKARAGVLYTPKWELSALMGVQLHRVPIALYEAIPLSFVADWFWNGASVYNAFTAECRAVKIHGAWVVTTVDFDLWGGVRVRSLPDTPFHRCVVSGGGGDSYHVSGKWQKRRKVSLADVEVLLRTELNSKRVADGLALIHLFLANALKK